MSTLTKMKIPYCFIKVQTLYVFIIKKQTNKQKNPQTTQQTSKVCRRKIKGFI